MTYDSTLEHEVLPTRRKRHLISGRFREQDEAWQRSRRTRASAADGRRAGGSASSTRWRWGVGRACAVGPSPNPNPSPNPSPNQVAMGALALLDSAEGAEELQASIAVATQHVHALPVLQEQM